MLDGTSQKKKRFRPFVVFSTVSSRREGKAIADKLLLKNLAACVNVVSGVDSFFWWQGSRDRAREHLLVIKTTEKHLKSLERLIVKHHSYDVPEIIGWPIRWGHQPYLKWIRDSLSS